MEYETSKVKVRTGPKHSYYIRHTPRLTLWQRVRILFGATLTTYIEMDAEPGLYFRTMSDVNGDSVKANYAHGVKWESLAPGGLLSPSQADRFIEIMNSDGMGGGIEDAVLDVVKARAAQDLDQPTLDEDVER